MDNYLRRANIRDKKLIFEWANDEETRKNSFNSDPIPWDSHSAWYDKKMSDENSKMFILMDFLRPVGVVRVDFEGNEGLISYSVAPNERGRGFGRTELILLEKELLSENTSGDILLKAEVKNDNANSLNIFEKLGYDKKTVDDQTVFTKKLTDNLNSKDALIQKKPRDAGFEILRIISMMMIIVLHYLDKGNLLNDVSKDMSSSNLAFWFAELLCICSVNVYVLISGYYMVKGRFSITKLIRIVLEVFFYSAGITLVMVILGLVEKSEVFNLYNIMYFFMPVSMGHYWFASCYVILLILSPILALAARKMSRNELKLSVILLLLFCFIKAILPFGAEYDNQESDIIWFVCLFMFASYVRLYGFGILKNKISALLLYLISTLCNWIYLVVAGIVNSKCSNNYQHIMEMPRDYNFFFVFGASVGLFMFFKELKFKDNIFTRFMVKIAPYTFGVYLFHEHLLIRFKWTEILRVGGKYGYYRPLHLVVCVLIVFIVGIAFDFIRNVIFEKISILSVYLLKKHYNNKGTFAGHED